MKIFKKVLSLLMIAVFLSGNVITESKIYNPKELLENNIEYNYIWSKKNIFDYNQILENS